MFGLNSVLQELASTVLTAALVIFVVGMVFGAVVLYALGCLVWL